MSNGTLSLVLGLSLVPASAFSAALEKCDGNSLLAHHVVETGHQVMGRGVVAYRTEASICFDLGCTSAKDLYISECKSGQTLVVSVFLDREYDGEKFDLSTEAGEILQMLLEPQVTYSLADVKVTFEDHDFHVTDYVEDEENCACSVTFPRMRNGKKKFED